jgi:hypothetical protein
MSTNFFEFREKLTTRRAEPPAPAPMEAAPGSLQPAPLSVTQLTAQIERAIRAGVPGTVLVKGEVSNFKPHRGSGHLYFTLKDASSCLSCVMWKSDAERVNTGISQGGGLTLAVAALSPRGITVALPDIPFLCDYRRAIAITPAGPYPEIPLFLKSFPHLEDEAMRTLSYFDNVNLAAWIKCRTVICNCLWDDVCPPSTIFAVYNHLTSEKQMEIYPYHKHEVPYEHHELRLRVLHEALKP